MPLVADVIQPADVRAVAREYPVAPGVGEEPAEFRLCPVALLVPATLLHKRRVVTVPAGSPLRQVRRGDSLSRAQEPVCGEGRPRSAVRKGGRVGGGGEGDVSTARGALCELETDASLEAAQW